MRRDTIGHTRYGSPVELFWEIRHGWRFVLGFSAFERIEEEYDTYCVAEAFRRRDLVIAKRDPTQGFFIFDDHMNDQLAHGDSGGLFEAGMSMGHITSLQRADYGRTLLCPEFRT